MLEIRDSQIRDEYFVRMPLRRGAKETNCKQIDIKHVFQPATPLMAEDCADTGSYQPLGVD